MDFKTIEKLVEMPQPWVNFKQKKFYHPSNIYLGFSIADSKICVELPRLIASLNNLLKEKVNVDSVELVKVVFDYDDRQFAEIEVYKFKIKERSDDTEKVVWVPNSTNEWKYERSQYTKVLVASLNIHDDVHMYLRHIGVYPK